MSSSSASAAGLAGRYATALFDLALEQQVLDAVGADLESFAGMLDDAPDLTRALASPLIDAQTKIEIIKALGARAGFSDLTVRFLGVMGQRGRLGAAGDVIGAFLAMLADHRGETTVEIASATPLEPGQERAVTDMLQASLGKTVRLQAAVDPALLGGLVVRVGSRMIDASLKTKLRHLELAMRGAG